MLNTEYQARAESLALLHDISGWAIGEELRSLKSMLEEMKSNSTLESYVWRTQGDDRVRESHAANNGKIFSFNNPPETGHPGEAFGCRCWAEPLDTEEYVKQTLITEINDNPNQWGWTDFARHYFFGNGIQKSLQEIGFLKEIINHYSETLRVYERVNRQIIDAARNAGQGEFTHDFRNTYEFGAVSFEFAGSTVSGVFTGEVQNINKFMLVSGIIKYDFFDDFADPYQIIEGTQYIFRLSRDEAIYWLEERFGINVDFSGTVYPIRDQWQTKFNATIQIKN